MLSLPSDLVDYNKIQVLNVKNRCFVKYYVFSLLFAGFCPEPSKSMNHSKINLLNSPPYPISYHTLTIIFALNLKKLT